MKILKYIRLLLFPFALLYGVIISIRNFLFDIGKLESKKFPVPIISIGNITVGGTGKTPLTEFIIVLLKDDYQLALLSRGYKRASKGVIISDENSTATDIGDEPMQIKQKFDNIMVTVAEKRVEGINAMLSSSQAPQVIVMDDGYQHRYVKPALSILVMDYNRPLWNDIMLPAGELREPQRGKKRADIVLVSKCSESVTEKEQCNIIKKLNLVTDQSVYFSSVGYKQPISLFCNQIEFDWDELSNAEVLLVTGIANPQPLINYLEDKTKKLTSIRYSDHYQFQQSDIETIRVAYDKLIATNKVILTTEKDAVRFKQVLFADDELSQNMWFIPIEIKILNNKQNEFTDKIVNYVKQYEGNC